MYNEISLKKILRLILYSDESFITPTINRFNYSFEKKNLKIIYYSMHYFITIFTAELLDSISQEKYSNKEISI